MPDRGEVSPDNVEFIRSLWEAVDEGGLEAALALTDPNVEWAPHPAGGRVLRTKELLSFLEEYEGERELLKATPYSISAHGDMVLASGSFRLHGQGGQISEFQIHWVSNFEHGRLVRARSYASEAAALKAIDSEREAQAAPPSTARHANDSNSSSASSGGRSVRSTR